MGAFWIYLSILTFIYIVYYVVLVMMDLFGNNTKKKGDVEVIAVANDQEHCPDEIPQNIKEEDFGLSSPDATSEQSSTTNIIDTPPSSPEEILLTDTDDLRNEIMSMEQQMTTNGVEAQDEVSADDYDRDRLAMLLEAGYQAVENM